MRGEGRVNDSDRLIDPTARFVLGLLCSTNR